MSGTLLAQVVFFGFVVHVVVVVTFVDVVIVLGVEL